MSIFEGSTIKHLSSWIKSQEIAGYYTFTKRDILSIGLQLKSSSMSNAISRQISQGNIMSPWQNFYVIVPTEYKLRGIIPPSFYIDKLMQFLGKEYYVSLLSAAELHGASHQRTMRYYVTVNGNFIRDVKTNGYDIDFTLTKRIPYQHITKVKVQTGYINVACAELTALDLVVNYKKIGGISRVAEIISELCESMQWNSLKEDLLKQFSTATIQRLGYILDKIGETEQGDNLYSLMSNSSRPLRRILLKATDRDNNATYINNRWKVIDNYTIEIDEL